MTGPAERISTRLAHLPADGLRALDGALERAAARARTMRKPVIVVVELEMGPEGLEAVEIPVRYERRTE